MQKFNPGDRALLKATNTYRLPAGVVTISGIWGGDPNVPYPYEVYLGGKAYLFSAAELEAIEPPQGRRHVMEKFKVGDKVRIKVGAFREQEGVVRGDLCVTPDAYSISVPAHPYPLWYRDTELEPVYTGVPYERLSELGIDLVMWPGDKGTIYEKVCKERGIIPEPGW